MLHVTRATPSDAEAVVAALRRAEGATHFDPRFYDATSLANAWQTKRLRSWIAVEPDGTVRGHAALAFGEAQRQLSHDRSGAVVEYGHAFTDPEFRHQGLAASIGGCALDWAARNEVAEVYSWALTLRPYAQLGLLAAGAQEICLLLAMSPSGVNRGYRGDISAPIAAMLVVLRLRVDTAPSTWFIPETHRAIVQDLMGGTSVHVAPLPADPAVPVDPALPGAGLTRSLTTEYVDRLSFGVIDVPAAYHGVMDDIAAADGRFAESGANVTYLDFDPTQADCMAMVDPLLARGFAFAGIHPNYVTGQLRFRLQRLHCALQPRASITTVSARGTALLDHVWDTLPR